LQISAILAACRRRRMPAGFMIPRFSIRQRCLVGIVVLATAGGAVWIFRSRTFERPAGGPLRPITEPVADRGFVGSAACKECHADQYASWYRTYHRTMTQPANAKTVLAPTGDTELSSRGRTFHLSHHGDEFSVTTVDPESAAQSSGGSKAAGAPNA